MQTPRIIKINNISEAKKELQKIGACSAGIEIMADKGVFYCIKLKEISCVVANIVKQEYLSKDGEAAVSYNTVKSTSKNTDILLLATLAQHKQAIEKLRLQPFGLKQLAEKIEDVLNNHDNALPKLKVGNKTWDFNKKTYVMGILNVTTDSFFDGGKYHNIDAAVKQALIMEKEGADIIDVGGESTRPGSKPIKEKEEIDRVIPIIRKLKTKIKIPISIDTYKAEVAKRALEEGSDFVNDISGLQFDPKMAKIIGKYNVPVCLMHIKGKPRTMQKDPKYGDLMSDIIKYFEQSFALAEKNGIKKDNIIIDPGIGFGKTLEHNLAIIRQLNELKVLGAPLLVGVSRKSLIGDILDLPIEERLEGSIATVAAAIMNGANIVRVHDVQSTVRAKKMIDAINRKRG